MLWVMEDNLRARAFYERQGFEVGDGRRKLGLVPDVDVWEVCYRKQILSGK